MKLTRRKLRQLIREAITVAPLERDYQKSESLTPDQNKSRKAAKNNLGNHPVYTVNTENKEGLGDMIIVEIDYKHEYSSPDDARISADFNFGNHYSFAPGQNEYLHPDPFDIKKAYYSMEKKQL